MGGAGHGEGEDVIADTSYHVIARTTRATAITRISTHSR